MKKLIPVVFWCAFATSCSANLDQSNAALELVMPEGSTIRATTEAGTIEIAAEKELLRSYTWEGETRSAELWPRPERWLGSLGAYYPGPDEHWAEHEGVTRGVLQEGQQHFASVREAKEWIELQSQHYPTVYRNDGLVVSFGKVPERKQINVEVWQIFIDGQKPTELPGSSDSVIEVIPAAPNE